jgi:arylsulfatase A-like enzyme
LSNRFGVCACCLVAVFATVTAAHAAPNVVVILADDLGYGDVHALNPNSTIPTPNFDRLASESMTFTDAHSPSAVCTPTRYALLTGRYSWRSSLKSGVLWGYSPPLMEANRQTLGTLMKSRGYNTGVVGKWHLGLAYTKKGKAEDAVDFSGPVTDGPQTHGFDFSFIIPASLDMPPYVFIRNGKITAVPDRIHPAEKFPAFSREGPIAPDLKFEDCLDRLLNESIGYLERRAADKQPFFLYFPMSAPHKPTLPHPRFRGKTNLGPYGDFVTQVDWTVGEVLNTLDRLGLADDTIVIFTSDNGSYMYRRDDPNAKDHVDDPSIQAFRADRHQPNYIFRGTKADIWEAGHHVAFMVRWPGVAQPGSQCDRPICHTDIFATLAEICDIPMSPKPEDTYSIAPLLRGDESTYSRPPVVHHSGNGMFALRDGEWKLVFGDGSGGREKPVGKPFERPYQLFNIDKDVVESSDVVKEFPDVKGRMEEELEVIRGKD